MIKKTGVNKLLNQIENRISRGVDLVEGRSLNEHTAIVIFSRFIDIDRTKCVILPTLNGKVLNVDEQTQIHYLLSSTKKVKNYFKKNAEWYSEGLLNDVERLPDTYNNLSSRYLEFKELERVTYSTEEMDNLLQELGFGKYAYNLVIDNAKYYDKEAWYIELTELLEIFECEGIDLLGIYNTYKDGLKDDIMTAICLNYGADYSDYIEEVKVGRTPYYRAKDISKADEIIEEYKKAYELLKSLA